MNPQPTPPEAAPAPPPPDGVERRASALLLLFVLLVAASVLFVLYARGAFEATQRLVLVADDSEGVQVGMDLTFSGFPIGRVRRIELAEDGTARILVDVPRRDARWLRTSSVFTLSRGLVGGTAIRAYSGILGDPPLPDGAERRVLAGDAAAEIPRMMSEVRTLVANLSALTAADAALAGTLGALQRAAAQIEAGLGGRRGALDLLLGQEAPRLVELLARSQRLLEGVGALVRRADGMVERTDALVGRAGEQLLGAHGVVGDAQAAVRQLDALLADARASLARVDRVLQEAEGVAQNARIASTDLGALRAQVEASLRKVEHLIGEVDRLWPFARDAQIELP